jgi:molecular chaperone GrpE
MNIMGESQDQNKHDSGNTEQESHSSLDPQAGEAPHTELPDEEEMETHPLEEEVGLLKDALLRTRAEMDNLLKRAERELEKSRKFAVEGVLKDLVPVIDSLDQGIENAAKSEAGSDEGAGMSLTRKLLIDTLSRHGLNVLDPLGERFDPQWHEAMSLQPSDQYEPDTVIAVLQRGYRLHDRLVRPARVIVARES